MTSQGSAHARFTRAIQRGNLFAAEMAARELRRLSLEDALAPIVLVSRWEAPRFDRAAVRWHGRLELETQLLTLPESQLALAALATLQGPAAHSGRCVLAEIGRRHRLPLAAALRLRP